MAGRIRTPRVRLRVLLASMTGASACLVLTGMVPSVELLFVAYTGTGVACGVLNACFGAIAILRIPESGRGQAMAIVGGMTRAVSIGALALGGLLGALVPVRVSFVLTGAVGALVALALTAYVLPRFGREDSAANTPAAAKPAAEAAADAALPARAAAEPPLAGAAATYQAGSRKPSRTRFPTSSSRPARNSAPSNPS